MRHSCPTLEFNLPIVSDEEAYIQCGSWTFFTELIEDLMKENAETMQKLDQAIDDNDHLTLRNEAHTLKGVAANLYLTALHNVSSKIELIAKQLLITPTNEEFLKSRKPFVEHIKKEFLRLKEVLPTYIKNAAKEDKS